MIKYIIGILIAIFFSIMIIAFVCLLALLAIPLIIVILLLGLFGRVNISMIFKKEE